MILNANKSGNTGEVGEIKFFSVCLESHFENISIFKCHELLWKVIKMKYLGKIKNKWQDPYEKSSKMLPRDFEKVWVSKEQTFLNVNEILIKISIKYF